MKELLFLSSHFQTLDPNFPFDRQDKDMTVANKIGVLYEEIVRDCQSLLNPEVLGKVIRLLRAAPRIYICASSAQLGVAEVFRDKMMKIGRLIHICTQSDEGFYHASYCDPGSLFFLVSYTGETRRVLKIAEKVRERGLRSVAVTSYGSNTLSSLCGRSLYVSTREKLIANLGAFGINVSMMYLLDVVYAGYFNRDYDRCLSDKIRHSSESENAGKRDGRHSNNPILEG